MNKKLVLSIEKQLIHLTKKKFSKTYINKKIVPIINYIAFSKKNKFLIGGSQGIGKSTLVNIIEKNIKTFYNKRVLTLSLDDYYYSRKKRNSLSNKTHPLLITRGVPGTHDIKKLITQIKQFNNSKYPIYVPVFDKLIDDTIQKTRKEKVKADILILEGWCCGTSHVKNEFLFKNLNNLERKKDNKGIWRRYYNKKLKSEYRDLYKMFDHTIFLKAPSFKYILNWRIKQEKMIQSNSIICKRMSRHNIIDFVEHYEKITKWMLKTHGNKADLVVQVNKKQQIISIKYN